jgi:hypothetical protein
MLEAKVLRKPIGEKNEKYKDEIVARPRTGVVCGAGCGASASTR